MFTESNNTRQSVLRIMNFSKVDENNASCIIEYRGCTYKMSIIISLDDSIRSMRILERIPEVDSLFHASSVSRDFSQFFWRFYDGELLSFPIICREI